MSETIPVSQSRLEEVFCLSLAHQHGATGGDLAPPTVAEVLAMSAELQRLRAGAAARGEKMIDYHVDAKCGVCGGPLEVTRDAICQACVPEAEFFRNGAALEKALQAGAWEKITLAFRHVRRRLTYAPDDSIAKHLDQAMKIFEQCGVHFEETS